MNWAQKLTWLNQLENNMRKFERELRVKRTNCLEKDLEIAVGTKEIKLQTLEKNQRTSKFNFLNCNHFKYFNLWPWKLTQILGFGTLCNYFDYFIL